MLALGLATFLLARLQPAIPTIARDGVWTDTVRRGEMIRQVRGLGTLVPEEIRWIASATDARIERIVVFPGATVQADTILLILANPELHQSTLDADAAVTAAQARLVNLRAQLQSQLLERQVRLCQGPGRPRYRAVAQVEVNEKLSKPKDSSPPVELKKSEITAKELVACCDIERQRVDFNRQSVDPQLAVAQGDLDQARKRRLRCVIRNSMRSRYARAWQVCLQQVPVDVGQRVDRRDQPRPRGRSRPSSRRRSRSLRPRRAMSCLARRFRGGYPQRGRGQGKRVPARPRRAGQARYSRT